MGIVEDLYLFDRQNAWPEVFQRIKHESLEKHNYSLKESRKPANRVLNRYGDVNPYDHSRISLSECHNDYINASLVKAEQANRAYILTQGPLPDTIGHFWLMVWQQESPAILMLNNMIEKGYIKCHQYFPTSETPSEGSMTFDDVNLKVTFIDELESNPTYVIRNFLLECTHSDQSRQIFQFHYTAWPDFGVPEAPSTFLEFLFVVRKYGFLDDHTKPPIIHCSAGIGRSGTFCLVDTCLILAEKEGGVEGLSVLDELMHMRQYRMGLIQTPEQLRFTYLAIIEGSSRLNCLSHCTKTTLLTHNKEHTNLQQDDHDSTTSNSDSDDDDDDDDNDDDDEVDDYSNMIRSTDGEHQRSADDDDDDNDNNSAVIGCLECQGNDDNTHPASLPSKKNDRNNNIMNASSTNDRIHLETTNHSERKEGEMECDVDENTSNNTDMQVKSATNDAIKVKHDERIRKMRENLERIQRQQRQCEIEREKGWFAWVNSPYFLGGVVAMAAALVVYRMV